MIQDACDALAAQVGEALGIAAYGYAPASLPSKPAAVVLVDSATYNRTARNSLTEVDLTLGLVIGRFDEEQSQRLGNSYMAPSGEGSVKAAVESDRTLGGKVKDCVVQSMDSVTYSDVGNDSVLVIQFSVKIYL